MSSAVKSLPAGNEKAGASSPGLISHHYSLATYFLIFSPIDFACVNSSR